MSLLWTQALQRKTESIDHILRNYQPAGGKSWRDVHDQTDWNHPIQQAFVNDIKRNGVGEPIALHGNTVTDHTRLLAAYRAGVKHVPVKDHASDPDSWVYASLKAEAMPWNYDMDRGSSRDRHPVVHPVKKAGFAGYTDDSEYNAEYDAEHGDDDDGEEFDDEIHESSAPEPTHEEQAHYDEHGEYPEDYEERHHQAYENALTERKRKSQEDDTPDRENPELMHFVREHAGNANLWRKHGSFGPVDISKGVHATQTHVSQTHIDRYLNNPHDETEHTKQYGHNEHDLSNDAPMFVTHHGMLHAIEGHHRTAAGLQRGDHHINAWHYDLDKDPAGAKGLDEDEWDDDQ
jgi:hypothetical protein